MPNVIKIDPHNVELYRFKAGTFFETQCISAFDLEKILILKLMAGMICNVIFHRSATFINQKSDTKSYSAKTNI